MVDSNTVLLGQTFAYTFYVLAIMLLMGWFAYNVTKSEGLISLLPSPLVTLYANQPINNIIART